MMKFSKKMMSFALVMACMVVLVSCDSKEAAPNSSTPVDDNENNKIQSKEYCEQGKQATQGRDLDGAIGYYGKAIDCDSSCVGAYHSRAAIYYSTKEYDKAISDCTEAIKLAPNIDIAYFYRANSYFETGQYDKALEDWNKYIEFNPDMAWVYYERGKVYKHLGEKDKAFADFTHVIEMKSANEFDIGCSALANLERALLYYKKGEHEAANDDRARAIELEPMLFESPDDINE